MAKSRYFGYTIIGVLSITSFVLAHNNSKKNTNDLAMLNIEALHASAGETTCDQTTKDECLIAVSSMESDAPIFGYSTGKLVVTN